MSIEDLIYGVIYTEFDDVLGPNPKLWLPEELSMNQRMLISIKTITLLTGEENILPKGLVMIPFPSIEMKALIKYIQWDDPERRGGIARTAITLLFNESDDAIFYKYMEDLKASFEEAGENISKMEASKAENEPILGELRDFQGRIVKLLEDLRKSEMAIQEGVAFPTQEGAEERFDYRFKVVVCGDPGSGKTSTVLRFTDNAFKRTYMPTIGVSISEKNVTVGKSNVNFIIWDVAGQSKFQMMRTHFYTGAEAVLLIFDLTREKTFQSIPNWDKDIKTSLGSKNIVKIGFILGNKKDLVDERKVSTDEGNNVGSELNLEYIETSALTGENINEAFIKIARALVPEEHI